MICKALVINKDRSFIIESMISELKRAKIECICTGYNVKEIDKKKEEVDIIILFASEYLKEIANILVYIKDVCKDDGKALYLAGYPDEIDEMEKIVPAELVKARLLRPFDTKVIVEEIINEAEEIQKRDFLKSVLLVDDDVTFLKTMKKWMMGHYDVTVVKSGVQAIKYLAGHKPDLILMDYEMPVTTGSKVLEMIRTEPEMQSIPVIFLTGKSDKGTVLEVMGLRPQGYLLKSMKREELLNAIDLFFATGTVLGESYDEM